MAIQIGGTTVINNDKELGSGLTSIYDRVISVGVSTTLQNRDFCQVTVGLCTITLPASPSAGNEVVVGVQTFTSTVIGRNSSNIMGLAENMTINLPNVTVKLVFVDATRGWRIS